MSNNHGYEIIMRENRMKLVEKGLPHKTHSIFMSYQQKIGKQDTNMVTDIRST